jgi:hypothetical protein
MPSIVHSLGIDLTSLRPTAANDRIPASGADRAQCREPNRAFQKFCSILAFRRDVPVADVRCAGFWEFYPSIERALAIPPTIYYSISAATTCREIVKAQRRFTDEGRRPHFFGRRNLFYIRALLQRGPIRPSEQFYAQRKWTSDRDSGRGASRLSRSTDTGSADRQHRLDHRTCRDLLFRALILLGRKRDPHASSVPQQ